MVHDRLRREAGDRGISLNKLVEQIVVEWLKANRPSKQEQRRRMAQRAEARAGDWR
jgi:hypothetical protein